MCVVACSSAVLTGSAAAQEKQVTDDKYAELQKAKSSNHSAAAIIVRDGDQAKIVEETATIAAPGQCCASAAAKPLEMPTYVTAD